MKALEGIRIADFSHVMAGPFASHFLAAMGAEVIKVEGTGRGDPMRDYGPDRSLHGMSPGFIAANCGKKSIALDLKAPQGLDAARRLIAASDVVLENFRPGVMDRLGLGYDDARKLKPAIIFCSVSGYGQSGPLKDWPAIDNIVQATSGITSLNGEPDGPFMRIGFPAVDTYAGTLAAMAILGALVRRGASGEGQRIDLAMFDAALVLTASAAVPYLVTGRASPAPATPDTAASRQRRCSIPGTAGAFRSASCSRSSMSGCAGRLAGTTFLRTPASPIRSRGWQTLERCRQLWGRSFRLRMARFSKRS
jgi:crotonobetainyl-CoA:carnitine CoA-transferase CaiB-like acyl-CoA transferase